MGCENPILAKTNYDMKQDLRVLGTGRLLHAPRDGFDVLREQVHSPEVVDHQHCRVVGLVIGTSAEWQGRSRGVQIRLGDSEGFMCHGPWTPSPQRTGREGRAVLITKSWKKLGQRFLTNNVDIGCVHRARHVVLPACEMLTILIIYNHMEELFHAICLIDSKSATVRAQ